MKLTAHFVLILPILCADIVIIIIIITVVVVVVVVVVIVVVVVVVVSLPTFLTSQQISRFSKEFRSHWPGNSY